jgi:pyruvate/2-oxoglutarate/acetoin dehydrogenase E1 component
MYWWSYKMSGMRPITFAKAIGEAIKEEMERDEGVFVQGEDVGRYGGGYYPALIGLWDKFGSERVRDFPISETAILGTAIGAAMTGLRPIVDIMFADFAFVAFDMVVNQMAKMRYMSGGIAKVPMVIRGVHGGYSHLASQHSHSPEAIFAQFPGLVIVTPSSGRTGKGLLKSAIRNDNPVVFLEHKMLYQLDSEHVPPESDFVLPLGKSEVVRQGSDVTIVANSYQTRLALHAADMLQKRGVSLEVVDLLTISPLDRETIFRSVEKTRNLVVVQEAPPMCGIAAEVISSVIESGISLKTVPQRVTGKQTPVPFSSVLEPLVLPSVSDIQHAVSRVMN